MNDKAKMSVWKTKDFKVKVGDHKGLALSPYFFLLIMD